MRTIRNSFALMLMGLAFVAFQVDADAQARRGESRSTTTTRSTTRSSSSTRSSSQNKSATVNSQSSSRSRSSATVSRSSSQSRPSSAVTRPSGQSRASSQSRSSVNASKPSSQSRPSGAVTRPSSQSRPSGSMSRPSGSVNRPSSQSKLPAAQPKPSMGSDNKRPQSGAVNDRKPSTTVKRPGDRVEVTRPGSHVGDRRPSQHRPSPGQGFKPDHKKPPVQIRPDHRHDKPRIHPIHRDFIAFDRPSHFWSHHNHYFGHRVRILPSRARLFIHHGISYYCYNDIWYRPYGNYYVICRPPFGTVLAADIIADIAWTAVRFSYYNTIANTYSKINENNEYIAQQNAVIAQNNAIIASQNQTIAMNQKQAAAAVATANNLGLVQSYAAANSEYFYQDGVFYTKSANGEYSVIIPPAGALVETLPEDYEMVTLDGNEYYKVDDTVYKVTLNEGKPFFEVMGQLYS